MSTRPNASEVRQLEAAIAAAIAPLGWRMHNFDGIKLQRHPHHDVLYAFVERDTVDHPLRARWPLSLPGDE